MKVMVETSARHMHVSDADLKVLFGENAVLHFFLSLIMFIIMETIAILSFTTPIYDPTKRS